MFFFKFLAACEQSVFLVQHLAGSGSGSILFWQQAVCLLSPFCLSVCLSVDVSLTYAFLFNDAWDEERERENSDDYYYYYY